jgi:hypothetical protein
MTERTRIYVMLNRDLFWHFILQQCYSLQYVLQFKFNIELSEFSRASLLASVVPGMCVTTRL